MDIKQLRNFCKIAEVGSLTGVAASLGLTQAALSRQMAALEADLAAELFRRTGRGLQLTAAGERLLEHAHLILQQVDQARRSVKEATHTAHGTWALGLPPSLARTMVLPLVEAFQAEIPEAALRSVDGLSANLMELVAGGKLDCAVVYNPAPSDKVDLAPLAEESLYLVSGPLALAAKTRLAGSVSLAEISTLPLISAGQANAIHTTLATAMAALGKTPQVVHEIGNLPAILDLVRKGHGYSVIPLSGVHSCIGDAKLRLHRVRRPPLVSTLFTALPARAEDPLTVHALAVLRKVVLEQLKQFDLEVEASIIK